MKNALSAFCRYVRVTSLSCVMSLAVIVTAPVLAHATNDCTAQTHAEIASQIANGHAFLKHSAEFVLAKDIAGLAFPDPTIADANDFSNLLEKILDLPTMNKALTNSRRAYWDSRTGTVIIFNPIPEDCGTAFRPDAGQGYYDSLH